MMTEKIFETFEVRGHSLDLAVREAAEEAKSWLDRNGAPDVTGARLVLKRLEVALNRNYEFGQVIYAFELVKP